MIGSNWLEQEKAILDFERGTLFLGKENIEIKCVRRPDIIENVTAHSTKLAFVDGSVKQQQPDSARLNDRQQLTAVIGCVKRRKRRQRQKKKLVSI